MLAFDYFFFFFQAEDGIRDLTVTGVQTCALPIFEVFQFVDADKLDVVYFDSSYYLIPDEHGEKPYYLMREALEQNNKVAVGRVVMHEKEHLIALRSYEGAILMTTLHYADEVRTPRDFPELKK